MLKPIYLAHRPSIDVKVVDNIPKVLGRAVVLFSKRTNVAGDDDEHYRDAAESFCAFPKSNWDRASIYCAFPKLHCLTPKVLRVVALIQGESNPKHWESPKSRVNSAARCRSLPKRRRAIPKSFYIDA